MLTCYERCLYLLYPHICTYCVKMFIFAPYRRVYSSISVDCICVHVCPTQEGSFQHLCGLTIRVHVCPTQEGSFQHLCGLTIRVHVCPTQEGSFQHLCGLHLWPGRHRPALCPLPAAGVCPLKPLRPRLPHWCLPVRQGCAADGRELQAAHLSALLQHLPSGTFSQSTAGLWLWLLLCVADCWVAMNWFVGNLSW